ncbi:hypothetical protein EYF80_014043 [Liparis tanakae]|uniref:Uncharacterized protein n=1 Tax=Liparis tanakae TaxID=230148 RepID=A0A4Z2ICK7_9TELE|nr:hypothetical protein EYF80_014043 [Liparis tanakae]
MATQVDGNLPVIGQHQLVLLFGEVQRAKPVGLVVRVDVIGVEVVAQGKRVQLDHLVGDTWDSCRVILESGQRGAAARMFHRRVVFAPLVEGPEALSGAMGSVPSQGIVLLSNRVPALVLVHDDRMLVGVLLQDADVRADQLQQVQLLR